MVHKDLILALHGIYKGTQIDSNGIFLSLKMYSRLCMRLCMRRFRMIQLEGGCVQYQL